MQMQLPPDPMLEAVTWGLTVERSVLIMLSDFEIRRQELIYEVLRHP